MTANQDFTRLSGIFTIVAILFGLLFLSVVFGIAKMALMQQWPAIQGEVTRQSSRGWYDEVKQRRYYLEYAYESNGRRYTGTRFHVREEMLRGDDGLSARYKEGEPIIVYYNPADPAEAVLNRDYPRDAFLFLFFTGGLLLLAATMIRKESSWRQLTDDLLNRLPPSYDGSTPLPGSPIVKDSAKGLQLLTGPSIFWTLGMPFAMVSFASGTMMLLLLNELNDGWSLYGYGGWILATWATGAVAALIMKNRRYTLKIDVQTRTMHEESRWFGGNKGRDLGFDDIREVRLYREKWRHDNPLRNWMMFVQATTGHSLTICRGFRDLQPASRTYLAPIKQRIEQLLGSTPR